MNHLLDALYYLLTIPVAPIGKTTVTVWMALYVLILLALLISISRLLRDKLLFPALAKSTLDRGAQHAIGMVAHYLGVGIGALIILNTAGIETTALTVVAGAVGLGLSLGLQTIARNFVGGVILLLERPVRLGDRIQIAGVTGDVVRIALRSTTVRTADETNVVIPNGDFMNEKITNWNARQAVVNIPVTVPCTLSAEEARGLLLEIAMENSAVLSEPTPEVWLESFTEKSMSFVLRVYTDKLEAVNGSLKSDLNFEIFKKLSQRAQSLKSLEPTS